MQSPLIMPTLSLDKVPVQYSAQQIKYLVHESEKFFPPLNMLCTLSNVVVAVLAYRSRKTSVEAAAKLPYALAGVALNIATTAWALTIMVPLNQSMTRDAIALETNGNNENASKSLRATLAKWRGLNLGRYGHSVRAILTAIVRASMMISASIVGVIGLLQDGSLIKL